MRFPQLSFPERLFFARGWVASFLLVLAANIGLPAAAQQLDSRVLEQLQGQLGAGTSGNASRQLDTARESSDERDTDPRAPTAEEIEVRREQSRQTLFNLAPASPIEGEFRRRTGDPTLRQFGYDLFQVTQPTRGGLTGALGGDYVLGVGDELVVTFQGATNRTQNARVDREGRVVVGDLPPIRASGRSLASVRSEITAATRRTLLGTTVDVSVGSVRAISVFVGGEVARPGQYQLTSLSDLTSALAQAGSIRRSGSLRSVRLVRGGSTQVIDLYGLLGLGNPPSVRLREGDRIIVPVIGDTVAIAGAVARPGIYEVRGPTTAGQLLAFAGGSVRPRGQDLAISRIGRGGQEEFLRASAGTQILPGDALNVLGGTAGGAAGRVLLRGYVQNPGSRPLALAPTVKALLGSVRDLQVDTYMSAAVLLTRDPLTGSRQYRVIDLGAALTGSRDIAFQDEDRFYVLSRDDASFINRPAVRNIVLGAGNSVPGCRGLERLEELVRDTQSQRYAVVTRGTFRTSGGAVGSVAEALVRRGTGDPTQSVRAAANIGTGGELGGAGSRALDTRADQTGCPPVFQEEPELLPVLIEHSVSVGGAVRRPGAYPVAGPVAATTMAMLAEGMLGQTSDLSLDITRSLSGVSKQERVAATVAGQIPSAVLNPGDDVRFTASLPQFEAGAVLVSGEVARPGLYVIRKGEKLSQLIERAGGITEYAYPYGAVFTRSSVREAQQEGFRRTSRELNEALLSIAARREGPGGGDALAAAGQFAQNIGTIEAQGRVVVEADPRVLALRPDLDVVLEAGDSIFMPKTPTYVLSLGDVNNPGAVQFVPGKSATEYLDESGGFRKTADDGRVFVVLPNGASQPLKSSWGRMATLAPPPGSTIIVPKNIDPLYELDVARDIATIIGQFISSVALIGILATQ